VQEEYLAWEGECDVTVLFVDMPGHPPIHTAATTWPEVVEKFLHSHLSSAQLEKIELTELVNEVESAGYESTPHH
jgi:hypothetical protein